MKEISHSVKLIEENCKGCTKCMIRCPVEAVRLKNSRAVIYKDKCIDCGECIRVCPYNAHVAEKDNIEEIKNYKIKVVIPSVALYSQFGDNINPIIINEAVKSLGFDEIYDMTYACDIVSEIVKKELKNTTSPAISSFCPAIVRLIQTSYPNLIEHLVRVLTPIEVSAYLIREKYKKEGYDRKDLGIFYLTPCVARITKRKDSIINEDIEINGNIAISDIYPMLLKYISKRENTEPFSKCSMSYTGLSWGIIGGQSKALGIKEYISVDEVENVIKILEDIERGKLQDVRYVEAFACTQGCCGGLLLVENPFNANRIIAKYANCLTNTNMKEEIKEGYMDKFTADYINKESYQCFSGDFYEAVKKMKWMNRLINNLPGIDCGQCGSPSCRAFAEDVVRGLTGISCCKMIKEGDVLIEDM